jgi:hypothetical protein
MCCVTHPYRDQLDQALALCQGTLPAFEALMAESEDFRCRCSLAKQSCQRRATGEDLICDWCRQTDHEAWARANLPTALGGQADLPRNYDGLLVSSAALDEVRAYSADFYQSGVVGNFSFAPGPAPFEFPVDAFRNGLAGMRISVEGSLAPAEIKSILGLPGL